MISLNDTIWTSDKVFWQPEIYFKIYFSRNFHGLELTASNPINGSCLSIIYDLTIIYLNHHLFIYFIYTPLFSMVPKVAYTIPNKSPYYSPNPIYLLSIIILCSQAWLFCALKGNPSFLFMSSKAGWMQPKYHGKSCILFNTINKIFCYWGYIVVLRLLVAVLAFIAPYP